MLITSRNPDPQFVFERRNDVSYQRNPFRINVLLATMVFVSLAILVLSHSNITSLPIQDFSTDHENTIDLTHSYQNLKEEIKNSSEAKVMTNTKKSKLFLHVGVMKTASTFVQLEVLKKQNRIYKKLLEDGYEVITEEYPPRKFDRVIHECLSKEDDCDYTLWNELTDLYISAKEWNHKDKLLQSLESFSLMPNNKITKELLYSLKDKYDVKIIIFYRRFHEWIASLYTQYRKHFMYRPRARGNQQWKQDYQPINKVKSFTQWLEDIVSPENVEVGLNGFNYTTTVRDVFVNIFGAENVNVLDFHSKHGLEVEFICNALPDANIACKEAKIIAHEKKNESEGDIRRNVGENFLLDHDFLVMEAYRQGLVRIGRHNATLLLQEKLEQMNISIIELPRECLSPERERWLMDVSLFAHRKYSTSSLSDDDLKQHFLSHRHEMLCKIDTQATLQNSTWRNLFSSCKFQKSSC